LNRTGKKCTKIYNALAQPLFWSLNLLFGNVLVAVAVVGCLRSLIVRSLNLLFGDVLVAIAIVVFLNSLIVLRRRRFLMNNALMTRRIRKIKAF